MHTWYMLVQFHTGTWGPERAQSYLRQLIGIARRELGHNVVLYTTDPPNQIERGTLRGDEVFSYVMVDLLMSSSFSTTTTTIIIIIIMLLLFQGTHHYPHPPPTHHLSTHNLPTSHSAVDFGPGWWQLDQAFGIQASYNPPGKSPPICTEF